MSLREIVAVALVILATLVTGVLIFAAEHNRRGELYTVELLARTPENGNWYPNEITVPYGEEVRMLIRNTETVTHGFALPEFDIAVSRISAGEVVVVEFTPDKRGTFPFMCTNWCSEYHLDMRGTLIVE